MMRVMALCTSMTQCMLQQRDATKQEEAAGHDDDMTRSIQGKLAAVARATSFDPSTDDYSMLEPIDIQAADMYQAALSNF
jgi:hypothetical protein